MRTFFCAFCCTDFGAASGSRNEHFLTENVTKLWSIFRTKKCDIAGHKKCSKKIRKKTFSGCHKIDSKRLPMGRQMRPQNWFQFGSQNGGKLDLQTVTIWKNNVKCSVDTLLRVSDRRNANLHGQMVTNVTVNMYNCKY